MVSKEFNCTNKHNCQYCPFEKEYTEASISNWKDINRSFGEWDNRGVWPSTSLTEERLNSEGKKDKVVLVLTKNEEVKCYRFESLVLGIKVRQFLGTVT